MSELQTVRVASAVYADAPDIDDPAEVYHEASKLGPATAARELEGAARLAASPELLATATRAVRRHPLAPRLPLGERAPLQASLGATLARRRSQRELGGQLDGRELAAILGAASGITGFLGAAQPLRAAPSAGALYPLELFVAARRVDGLAAAIYHHDPLQDVLELWLEEPEALATATPYADLVADAAAVVVLTACFWRSRFKYGLRAYRFTLLEAGHVAQNVLLAAAALELPAVPLGGFFDRRLDDVLGLDGVDESSLYLVCLGGRRDAP